MMTLATASSRGRDRGQGGYNFVILVMAIAVLNILAAASLPLWSYVIRRDKEEELIFRGFQYAEAIRVYKLRSGGQPPTRLAELIEREPRSIRQLWKDPMTEDGKWSLIFQNQGRQLPPPGDPNDPNGRGGTGGLGGRGGGNEGGGDDGGGDGDGDGDSTFGPKGGEEVQIGPIIGVRSKSREASIIIFYGRERYDEWEFTDQRIVEVMGGGRINVPGAGVPTGAPPTMSIRWAGRPLPQFLQPAGMPPDGTRPDGTRPRAPNRGGFGGSGGPGGNPRGSRTGSPSLD